MRVRTTSAGALLVGALLGGLLLGGLLAGCSAGEPSADPSGSADGSATGTTGDGSAVPTPLAVPDPPEAGTCYRLSYAQAVAPTARAKAVDCGTAHTSVTYAVGTIGELLPEGWPEVDAPKVQAKVGAACTDKLAGFLGGGVEERRLSMFRPVWFTPTLDEAAAGSFWYRCDVVALNGHERLDRLQGRIRGVLGREGWRARYGLCATAEPGTEAFDRVSCGTRHAWRALQSVPIPGTKYPGVAAVRARGQEPCRSAARAVAADPLDYRWGYEWPTAQQWSAGTRYGVCWVPA